MSKFIMKTVDVVFYILVAIILCASISTLCDTICGGWINCCLFGLCVALIFVFLYYSPNILKLLKDYIYNPLKGISVSKMIIIIAVISLFTKIFFVFLLDNQSDGVIDMRLYHSFAKQIAHNGVITEDVLPAQRYSYQVIYGLFLSPVVKLFGDDTKVVTTFLSVLTTIASVLLFDILRKYIGKEIAFIGIVIYNILPVGMFQTQLLVHETPLHFFHILSLWLFLKALDNKTLIVSAILIVLSAVSISFGNLMNKGGTVIVISFCIFAAVKFFMNGITIKGIVKFLAIICCFVLCLNAFSAIRFNYTKNVVVDNKDNASTYKDYALSYGWNTYLGFNFETSGHWNKEDLETYEKYVEFDNKEDAINYQKEIISERLSQYIENPLKFPIHLFNKFKGLWGQLFLPFAYESGNSISSFILKGAGGIIYKGMCFIAYISFILTCTIILFSRKRLKNIDYYKRCTPEFHFKMHIVGLTLVLILFEVMPKYVNHLQIIMFSVMLFELKNYISNTTAIKNKIDSSKMRGLLLRPKASGI